MRPCVSVAGTRWTRWTPLSNFSRANTCAPVTEAMTSLKPPISPARRADRLHPPALQVGVALVHAEQVAGEQRRLVAAGAGADFEHRRLVVGGVARQQLERQRALGERQRLGDRRRLRLGHLAHLGIGEHRVQSRRLVAQPPHLGRRGDDGGQLGIVLRQRDELVRRQVGIAHLRREVGVAALDLRDAFGGDGDHRASPVSWTRLITPTSDAGCIHATVDSELPACAGCRLDKHRRSRRLVHARHVAFRFRNVRSLTPNLTEQCAIDALSLRRSRPQIACRCVHDDVACGVPRTSAALAMPRYDGSSHDQLQCAALAARTSSGDQLRRHLAPPAGSATSIASRSIPAAQPTAGVCGPPIVSIRPS